MATSPTGGQRLFSCLPSRFRFAHLQQPQVLHPSCPFWALEGCCQGGIQHQPAARAQCSSAQRTLTELLPSWPRALSPQLAYWPCTLQPFAPTCLQGHELWGSCRVHRSPHPARQALCNHLRCSRQPRQPGRHQGPLGVRQLHPGELPSPLLGRCLVLHHTALCCMCHV